MTRIVASKIDKAYFRTNSTFECVIEYLLRAFNCLENWRLVKSWTEPIKSYFISYR